MFDEVYVKPSVRFRGGHLIGHAEDKPDHLARTVLALMLKPLMSRESFIIRLIPVHTLTAEFLLNILKQSLLRLLEEKL